MPRTSRRFSLASTATPNSSAQVRLSSPQLGGGARGMLCETLSLTHSLTHSLTLACMNAFFSVGGV